MMKCSTHCVKEHIKKLDDTPFPTLLMSDEKNREIVVMDISLWRVLIHLSEEEMKAGRAGCELGSLVASSAHPRGN